MKGYGFSTMFVLLIFIMIVSAGHLFASARAKPPLTGRRFTAPYFEGESFG
jgi:hypothetical protein